MKWWIVYQMFQWATHADRIPETYWLPDTVFFAQSRTHQMISLAHPDTFLLDASIFHATNEARRQAGLPVFFYDRSLYQAARKHAESMIRNDYYNHENPYILSERNVAKRVHKQGGQFERVAENIGQYQVIDTPDYFSVLLNAKTNRYEYFDYQTKRHYQPYTYAGFARYAVQQWLASRSHRAALLNPVFTHLGCAVRLSPNPFLSIHPPFGRFVQNFGTYIKNEVTNR